MLLIDTDYLREKTHDRLEVRVLTLTGMALEE